jgi:hypothetical protein
MRGDVLDDNCGDSGSILASGLDVSVLNTLYRWFSLSTTE